MSRKFHIGDILSITTGVILCDPSLVEGRTSPADGLYDILNYMSGESLKAHAVSRAANEAKPCLEWQFPWTKEVQVPDFMHGAGAFGQDAINKAVFAFVQRMVAQYGAWHDVIPMCKDDHEHLTPLEDVLQIKPDFDPNRLIEFNPDEPKPPSTTGNIN